MVPPPPPPPAGMNSMPPPPPPPPPGPGMSSGSHSQQRSQQQGQPGYPQSNMHPQFQIPEQQPQSFPVTYEGWVFRKLPASGENTHSSWANCERMISPFTEEELLKEIKKRRAKTRRNAMEEYNALRYDNLRWQVDNQITVQKRDETNRFADWKLASVWCEKRDTGRWRDEVIAMHVVLKRFPRVSGPPARSPSFSSPVGQQPGFRRERRDPSPDRVTRGGNRSSREDLQHSMPGAFPHSNASNSQPNQQKTQQRPNSGPSNSQGFSAPPPPPPPPAPTNSRNQNQQQRPPQPPPSGAQNQNHAQQVPPHPPAAGRNQKGNAPPPPPPPSQTQIPQSRGTATQPIPVPKPTKPVARKASFEDSDSDTESDSSIDSFEIIQNLDSRGPQNNKSAQAPPPVRPTTPGLRSRQQAPSFPPPPMGQYAAPHQPSSPKRQDHHQPSPAMQNIVNIAMPGDVKQDKKDQRKPRLNRVLTPPMDSDDSDYSHRSRNSDGSAFSGKTAGSNGSRGSLYQNQRKKASPPLVVREAVQPTYGVSPPRHERYDEWLDDGRHRRDEERQRRGRQYRDNDSYGSQSPRNSNLYLPVAPVYGDQTLSRQKSMDLEDYQWQQRHPPPRALRPRISRYNSDAGAYYAQSPRTVPPAGRPYPTNHIPRDRFEPQNPWRSYDDPYHRRQQEREDYIRMRESQGRRESYKGQWNDDWKARRASYDDYYPRQRQDSYSRSPKYHDDDWAFDRRRDDHDYRRDDRDYRRDDRDYRRDDRDRRTRGNPLFEGFRHHRRR